MNSSLYQQLQNDSSNGCHPFLLQLNYTNYRGLCDDHPVSRVITSLFLGFYTVMVVACLIGLFYKNWKLKTSVSMSNNREVNYISVARNPALMVFGTLTSYSFVLIQLLRVVISRKMYPCFMFTFTYWMAVPGLAAIIIGRCVRLIALTWMNQLKVKIGKEKMSSQSFSQLDVDESKNQVELKGSSIISQSLSSISMVGNSTLENQYQAEEDVSTTPGQSEASFVNNETNKEEETRSEDLIVSRMGSSAFDRKKLATYRFFTSSKFIFILFAFIYGVHLIIYFSVGVVDYYNVQSGSMATNVSSNSFVIGTHILSPEGCGNGTYNLVVMATYFGVYVLILVGFFIVALFMKNDVWKIKWELFMICFGWFLSSISYAIPSFFDDISRLADYFFPWQLFIVFGCIWDTFISHFLPVFIYQRSRKQVNNNKSDSQTNSQDVDNSNIKKCLTSKKWNAKFLTFNEKSYCPEDIMMWNTIEQFKMIKSNKKRVQIFQTIVKNYLVAGAPLELNIARSLHGIPGIMQLYGSIGETNVDSISVSISIFNDVEIVCEHNMLDSFFRFYSEYRKELLEELGIKFED